MFHGHDFCTKITQHAISLDCFIAKRGIETPGIENVLYAIELQQSECWLEDFVSCRDPFSGRIFFPDALMSSE